MKLDPKEEDVLKLIVENSEYENYFINKVSAIKWFYPLKEMGFFKPEKAPGPKPAQEKGSYYIPEWNVLPYLERISQQIITPPNEKYIDELLEIIKNVSNKTNSAGEHIDNYRTWYYFLKILINIPNERIPLDIIELIPLWLESKYETSIQGATITTQLLPKFLKEQATSDDIKRAEKIISFITDIKITQLDREREEFYGKKAEHKFKIDSYWLEKTFDKYLKQIVEKCTFEVVRSIVDKIKKMIINQEDGAYESFYISKPIYEPLDLLTEALKNILNEKAKINPKETKAVLINFLDDSYYFFQKIALYVFGKNIDHFQDIVLANFDKVIGESVKRNYFVGDELKHLLKNLHDLTPEQKKVIKAQIEKGPKKDIPDEEHEKSILRWKQKIYQALISDIYFKELYDELRNKTKKEAELRPGIVWLGLKSGKEESPLSSEDIIKKSNDELADFIFNFKTVDFWKGPSVDGLSDLFKDVVQKYPEKLLNNLTPFLKLGYLYVYDILSGIRDAWKEKKNIDWKNLFSFVKKYLKQEGFWEDKLKISESHWGADSQWVLRLIGEIIQEGTKDDSWAFNEELLSDEEEILFLIIDEFLKEYPKEDDEAKRDPVTHAINSAAGNIIAALILLALRTARLQKEKYDKTEERWSSQIRDKYNKLLESHISEAFTQFGQYLPNLWYLDKKWVNFNIEKFIYEDNEYWSNFFIGYLYLPLVYLEFLPMMQRHYERAMDFKFKEKTAEERYIQHIAIGYLESIFGLKENSLMQKMLDTISASKMDILARYFRSYSPGYHEDEEASTEKADKMDEIRTKVLDIWRYVYEKYKGKSGLSTDEKDIVSYLMILAIFLPKIDHNNFQWIIFSLTNMRRHYEFRFLIEDLIVLNKRGEQPESAIFVGNILKEILKITTPTIFKENIKTIVQFLYEQENDETKRIADDVCNTYAKRNVYSDRGELFLRDLYETYNRL